MMIVARVLNSFAASAPSRMVARRVSDDASIQRFTRQRTDGAAGATELKSGDLQGFRF